MEAAKRLFSEDLNYPRLLAYFLILYASAFIFLDLLRLWGFGYYVDDIGIYNQVIWNSANGDWFQTSIKFPYKADSHWLGFHFSVLPIIFAVPFYKLFPHVETLIFIHVLLVSSASIIVYKICRKLELQPAISFFWSIIYLINPFTIYHALFSFQETSFAVTLTALAIYYVISARLLPLLITSFLLILTKEQHGLTVFGLGLLWLWYNKSWREGTLLCVSGIIGFLLVMLVIIPAFSPYKEHFMFVQSAKADHYLRYQWMSLPFKDLIKIAPQVIFFWQNTYLVFTLLLTFLFIPLRTRGIFFLLPVAGDLAIIILSNSIIPKSFFFYYSAPFIIPLIIASIYTFKKTGLDKTKLYKPLLIFVFIVNLIGIIMALNVSARKVVFLENYTMDWAIGKNFQNAIKTIPADKSLTADQPTGAFVSDRRLLYSFVETEAPRGDYALLRIDLFNAGPSSVPEGTNSLDMAKTLANSPDWSLIYWKYPYVVFAKKYIKNSLPESDKKDLLREIERGFKLNTYVEQRSNLIQKSHN